MKLREYCEQKLEALGIASRIELDLDDGSTIELVHPWLWDDKTQAAVDAAKSTTETAKAVLGAADHKRLIASGGSSNEVVLAIEMMKRADKGTDKPAESDPKGS